MIFWMKFSPIWIGKRCKEHVFDFHKENMVRNISSYNPFFFAFGINSSVIFNEFHIHWTNVTTDHRTKMPHAEPIIKINEYETKNEQFKSISLSFIEL